MLVEDLTLIKCIGKGAFGEVYLTSKQGSKEKFATKKMDKKYANQPKVKKYFDNEIGILKEVNHPNIVKLEQLTETNNSYYLVFELCNGGGLSDCLEKYQKKFKKPFTEEIVQYLMKQIVSALKYLHNNHILHRDLKLDNILVKFENDEDKNNLNMLKSTVKIIDFGFARKLQPGDLAYSTLGSPINMDPIILKKLNKIDNYKEFGYDEKADIWSLGTLCYEMLIGKCTFDAESMKELVSKVEKGNYYLPTTLSKEAVSFLNGMLQYDIKRRLSADDLSRHHFLTKKFSDLTPINLKEAKNKIEGKEIKINSKQNQSIWVLFDTDGPKLDDISGMIDPKPQSDRNNQINALGNQMNNMNLNNNNEANIRRNNFTRENSLENNVKSEAMLKEEFLKAFEIINSDFIYTEPKMIPIIPGDDPAVINRASEFSEDS